MLPAGITAVAAFALAAVLAASGIAGRPVLAHLVFAIGVLPLIFAAMLHFVPVLTRSGTASRWIARVPLAAQLAGVLVVLSLSGVLPRELIHLAAGIDLALALLLMAWMQRRARRAVGAVHPGWRWYFAALALLAIALAAIVLPSFLPQAYPALRSAHLHLNTLGFIGLAAFGTLPVLLPTALAQPDAQARERLGGVPLALLAGGALLVASAAGLGRGSAGTALAILGSLCVALPAVALIRHWLRRFGVTLVREPAAVSLALAAGGFVLLLAAGVLHALRALDAQAAIGAFVALFLLPLVSGALTQLLPVWRHAGPDSAERRRLRAAIGRWTPARVGAWLSGGLLLLGGYSPAGVACVLLGLALWVAALLAAAFANRATPQH